MTAPVMTHMVTPAHSMFSGPQGKPLDIFDFYTAFGANSSNASIIAAVAGKKIRCIGYCAWSAGAVTTINFKSASGGTVKYSLILPANTVANPNILGAPNSIGYFDTNSGEGLFADTGAVICFLSIRYILVDPLT